MNINPRRRAHYLEWRQSVRSSCAGRPPATGVTVPDHQRLVTRITRWANNRPQPDEFYRGLPSRTLGWPEGELFDDAVRAAEQLGRRGAVAAGSCPGRRRGRWALR